MLIFWDEPKRLANRDKHGFDFAELDVSFFERARLVRAKSGRLMAIGRWRDGLIVVVFRPLGREAVSVISMRVASRGEKELFK